MARFIEPVTLEGDHVRLLPLDRKHHDALVEAACDGELWKLWYTSVPDAARTSAYIDTALEMRERLEAMPFVIERKSDNKIVGSTRYFNVDSLNRRLEIGHTWYAKTAQRTALNTEAKLVLLSHAFDKLDCIAVEFRTHWMNHASRAAIARLGAKQDGVLRNHAIGIDGTLRDTVVFSITASEWPTIRYGLAARLDRASC
jgi:RimJ/RimL family protein N-acetyltransferase